MSFQKFYVEERAPTFHKLRHLMEKLQKRFLHLAAAKEGHYFEEDELEVAMTVPDDVKEGYFAVLAVNGAEKKRFVVKLKYLTSPTFLRLLDQAEEEYGFEQTGALVLPCRPEVLCKILEYKSEF